MFAFVEHELWWSRQCTHIVIDYHGHLRSFWDTHAKSEKVEYNKVHRTLHGGLGLVVKYSNKVHIESLPIWFSNIFRHISILNMLAAFVILCLGLLHLSKSAAPDCQQLARPLDQVSPEDLEGKWTIVAGGLNNTASLERFKRRDSALMNYKAINGTSTHFMRNDAFNESCHFIDFVITLEGSGFTFPKLNLTVTFLHRLCPDCMSIHFDNPDKSRLAVYLISRRREVEQAEMEEFRAQMGCLHMSYVAFMDPTKKLCQRDDSHKTNTQENPVDGGQSA